MSTLKVDSIGKTTGATQDTMEGLAKVWINYDNVQTTTRDSFNVTSLTDTGTGDATINFTNSFGSASIGAFAYPGEASANSRCGSIGTRAAASVQVLNKNAANAAVDPNDGTSAKVLGDLA